MPREHTPAPWTAHAPGCFSPSEADWMITGGVAPDPVTEARYMPVAKVFRTSDPNPLWRQVEESEANARLIAAAPELLEACENLENDDGSIPDHAWQLVQRAIAKARGEQPHAA